MIKNENTAILIIENLKKQVKMHEPEESELSSYRNDAISELKKLKLPRDLNQYYMSLIDITLGL